MSKRRLKYFIFVQIFTAFLFTAEMRSAEFDVASFRALPNDVSAFINPVRDLNDEDCALLKVVAPEDFVFSTPLGIVKRVDNTGEIWLYVPRGSHKITIKHPKWGVLRDYEFPSKVESHMTYEIALLYPKDIPTSNKGESQIVTVRDTLVVTRTDTLVIRPVKKKIPFECDIIAGMGMGGKAPYLYENLMVAVMTRHGGYIRVSSNMTPSKHSIAHCDRYGGIDGHQRFYTGDTQRSVMMIGAGATHRISDRFTIFEGVGYADNRLDWRLADSEGGGYVRNSYFSHKGMTAEVGMQLRVRRVVFSASAMTLKGSEWFGNIGIGYRFGKIKKHKQQ